MKNIFIIILTLIIADLTLSRCANPRSPTGGPKDTVPPSLISSTPVTGSTNFKDQSISLTFSEFINADKLLQNLIITPKTDVRFKHIVKRNILNIKFDESFSDSTTYSLNFFDGVTDITEKNPAVNLILAFSTGTFIDSMQVTGSISDLLTAQPSKSFIVGLFPLTDSLDFLKHSPTYFTTANDSGRFSLSYVKSGEYRILAFKDENRNLLLDPKEEDHAFIADTLQLYDSIPDLEFSSVLQNVKPIQLTNHRPVRAYHEFKFSREIDKYSIKPDSIYSSISGEENDIIRLYNPNQFNFGDSSQIVITVSDSLSNTIEDTVKIVFSEFIRKPPALTVDLSYKEKKLVTNPLYTIKFNKPIVTTDLSKFAYIADSTFTLTPDSSELTWNQQRTELQIRTFINRDSVYSRQLASITLDTSMLKFLPFDSLEQISPDQTDSIKQIIVSKSPIEFSILPGAFFSVEGDTSKVKSLTHKKEFRQAFGTLQFTVVTEKPSFTVQLLSNGNKVAYESVNNKTPVFTVKPASYSIRVLIDTNNDGKWSFGNLLKNQEPEEVYLFPEVISIRENWIVGEDIQIIF
ncbi:MAG: Ig-like domain-containing domain [Cyclobacteriaceae bacterium]